MGPSAGNSSSPPAPARWRSTAPSGTGITCPAGPLVGTSAAPLDAKLGALVDLGGPTPAIAPLAGSPAIDAAIPTALTPATDQRGFARTVDGDLQGDAAPDIGAIETEPPAPTAERRIVPALPLPLQGLLGLLLLAVASTARPWRKRSRR